MIRCLVLAALLAAACAGDPQPEPCNGGALQVLAPLPGEDFRYQYLACDGAEPRLTCSRKVGAAAVTCEGDPSPVCCT